MHVLVFLFSALICCCLAEIYDPAYIFCGSANCYDILELERTTATARDIKKVVVVVIVNILFLSLLYVPEIRLTEGFHLLIIPIRAKQQMPRKYLGLLPRHTMYWRIMSRVLFLIII